MSKTEPERKDLWARTVKSRLGSESVVHEMDDTHKGKAGFRSTARKPRQQ